MKLMVLVPKLFSSIAKEELIIRKSCFGFSTLEMLIAMTVLILVISAVILVLFGSQSLLIDSQTNAEALNKTQELLEEQQAKARQDFNLVNHWPTTPSDPTNLDCPTGFIDDIYCKEVFVNTQPDYLTKEVIAKVSWTGEHSRYLYVSLSALVTNFNNAVGGDTCDSVLTGDWTQPNPPNIIFVSDVNTGSSLSVDAYNRKLFLAIGDAYASSASTIFIYNLTDPVNPTLAYSIDNENAHKIKAGINDIYATDKYLYAAKATGPASGQLQIFDVSSVSQVGNDFKVSGVTGTGGEAIGNSIFYKDGYVYLGLTATGSGPEFHIIDVHDPANPSEVGHWPSTGNINHDINAIYVKNGYAYLVHPAGSPYNEQLTILDVRNPSSPNRVGYFYDDGGIGGNGKSIDLVGDILYLGRTATNLSGAPDTLPEFYILNNSDPTSIADATPLGTLPLSASGDSVNGIKIRDYLAFLITTDGQFQIWRIDNPSSITQYFTSSITGKGTSLDCEGNFFYAGSMDSGDNKSYLSVISAP